MSTRTYALPVEQTRWSIDGSSTTVFTWEYDEGRDRMLTLYEKGKQKQWNAATRLDWSHDLDPDNPLGIPDEYIGIHGSPMWERLGERERIDVRRHNAAWSYSQFMHGEQGALVCASKIVQTVPDIDSKFYAATQVIDEARHVETYCRFLHEKLGLAYPINRSLQALLEDVIHDSRWDMTYLGMQVLIEGLALAAFGLQRDYTGDPLARALNAYVMQDEARHVAFGRIALRDYYKELTEQERVDREEFAVTACFLMRDRFLAQEVWENLGIGSEALEWVDRSPTLAAFRQLLFSRIVPTLRDIGIFGPQIQRAFTEMGVLGFAEIDMETMGAQDESTAEEIERQLQARAAEVDQMAQLGAEVSG